MVSPVVRDDCDSDDAILRGMSELTIQLLAGYFLLERLDEFTVYSLQFTELNLPLSRICVPMLRTGLRYDPSEKAEVSA